MNRKSIAAVITIGVVALVAAGCDSGSENGHDAGVAKGGRNDTNRHVYNMPKGVPNITVFCSLGNLIYEGSRSGSGAGFVTVVVKAPQCVGVADGGVPNA